MFEGEMKKGYGKTVSQRQLRVSEQVRHVLARAFERGELSDPEVQGLIITVTKVEISPDLRNASAFIIPLELNRTIEIDQILSVLNKAQPFFRKLLARTIYLKKVPQLKFFADHSFDFAMHIDGLIRKSVESSNIKKVHDKESVDGV